MLCECNLLSRYNQHAERLREEEVKTVAARDGRIEAKLIEGMSSDKGTRALAAETSMVATLIARVIHAEGSSPLSMMTRDFRLSLQSYSAHPGFSNQSLSCAGDTVSRSFLADLCDKDRLMGAVTPSGISLIAHAKKDLNMPTPLVMEGATKQCWIEANNLPGMVKLLRTLQDSEIRRASCRER